MKLATLLVLIPLALLVFLVHSTTPSRILVITFFSSKSHKITYMRLLEELASRGHQITIVTPIKAPKPVKNIREIFTEDINDFIRELDDPYKNKESGKQMNPLKLIGKLGDLCKSSLVLPQVQAILKEEFDMVFTQPSFNECVLGMVYKLNSPPLVLFTPIPVPDLLSARLGSQLPPSFVPNLMLGYSDEMTFFQRFKNFGMGVLIELLFKFYWGPYMTSIYREKLNDESIPQAFEILENASLILSNSHFSLSKPRPFLPGIVEVGGIHSKEAKPLDKDLEDFISQGKDGFILFSMGSAMKDDKMPEEKRKIFLNVFSKLKQQVIWKWDLGTMDGLPKNVKLSKWLPQQDLLGHKKIKLFITHCGGGGTEEAIFHGVPLIGIPMYGDQVMNAEEARRLGFLYPIDWNELTEKKLMEGVKKVVEDPSYRENVQKLSKVFRDQPDDPLARGVFWVEYVLRHKGAPQLRSASRDLYYFQYHSYDVIAAYLAIIYAIVKLICCIVKLIGRKCCGFGKKTKSTSMQKKNK